MKKIINYYKIVDPNIDNEFIDMDSTSYGDNYNLYCLENYNDNLSYKIIFRVINLPHVIEDIIFTYVPYFTVIKHKCYFKYFDLKSLFLSHIFVCEFSGYVCSNVLFKTSKLCDDKFEIFNCQPISLYRQNINDLYLCKIINLCFAYSHIYFGKLNAKNIKYKKNFIKYITKNKFKINLSFYDNAFCNPKNIFIVTKINIFLINQKYENELCDILLFIQKNLMNLENTK